MTDPTPPTGPWTIDSDGDIACASVCLLRPMSYLPEDVEAVVADLNDVARLRADNTRLREFLEAIAEPDALLDANEDVFNDHAARWMKAQARAALDGTADEPTGDTPNTSQPEPEDRRRTADLKLHPQGSTGEGSYIRHRTPVSGQPEPTAADYHGHCGQRHKVGTPCPVAGQPEPCPTCKGRKRVWDPDDGAGMGAGMYRPCPDCTGNDDNLANLLHGTTDASVWAHEFVKLHGGDEDLMLAWFANAIEVGRGAGQAPAAGQPEPCPTCQDRGWVWEGGNPEYGEGGPVDCPDCGADT